MEHLDISEVRSRDRIVTQTLGRFVFERDAAGVLYRSNLDDLPRVALFEQRAALTADGEARRWSTCRMSCFACARSRVWPAPRDGSRSPGTAEMLGSPASGAAPAFPVAASRSSR